MRKSLHLSASCPSDSDNVDSLLLRRSNIGVEVNTYAYSDITKACSNTQYTAIAFHTRYTATALDYRRTFLFV